MGKKDKNAPKAGKVRKLSVISRLHANMNRVDKHMGTWMYGLMWFKQDIGVETVRRLVKEKLLTIPRFRSYLKETKRKREVFVELAPEEVDLDYHVKNHPEEWSLDKVLQEFVDDAFKNFEFNMDLPMWQFNYFPKVDGRSLVLFTVNHAIGDGVSIVEVLYKMMDKEAPVVRASQKFTESPVADDDTYDQDEDEAGDEEEEEEQQQRISMEKTAAIALPAIENKGAGDAARPKGKRRKAKNGFGPLNKTRIFLAGTFAPILDAISPAVDTPSPLMRNPGEESEVKSTAFTDVIPLEKVKEIKNRYPGATINDVLVTVLQLTLKSYLEHVVATSDDEKKKKGARDLLNGRGLMRASFPISVRKKGEDAFRDGSPHNKLALGSLAFQFKSSSRCQLLHDTKRTLDAVKLSPTPFVQQSLANNLIRVMSKEQATALFKKVGEAQTSMLSNVPGPAKKVHLAGYEVDDLSFCLHGGPSLYLGLLSYAGNISCCVCMDKKLGDAKDIAKHWLPEFNALYEQALACGDRVPNRRGCTVCFDKF